MSLVVFENVGLSFSGRSLFSDLNIRIGETDRIGVVGRNGSGKSSLFRLCAGVSEPEDGSVRAANGLRLGYLAQDLDIEGGRSLIDSVLASVPGRADLEASLAEVERGLETSTVEQEQLELSERLVDLHEQLQHFESRYSRHEALRILSGLGFQRDDFGRDLTEFSGGWRMRAVLAGLLFQRPDLLLLDEPTNHLDVPTVSWLADFLKRHSQAFMLICHDREFLNEQVSRIIAFEPDGVRQFSGNYEQYRTARVEEIGILERRAANLAREREQAERFIRRFRAQATKARAVQSRVKALEKMEDVALPQSESTLSFSFPPCPRAGQDAVTLKDAEHDYGRGLVFSGLNAIARRGDRIAVVGANGNGKSTLLKIIADRLQASGGLCKLGHNVAVGYYAQHVTDLLDLSSTIADEVWRSSAVDDLTKVRTALGTMMFSGDDVDKKIGVLSGGEKARVALACMMVNPGNLMVMDEPTNHLDLESAEALADALATFDGTLIFASHNRSFVNRLATRIWDVDGGRVEEFEGTLKEYMHHCALVAREVESEVSDKPAKPSKSNGNGTAKAGANGSRKEKVEGKPDAPAVEAKPSAKSAGSPARKPDKKPKPKISGNRAREMRKQVADFEKRIAGLETVQAERSAELSKPETYADQERYNELFAAFRRDAEKIEELMARWEQVESELTAGE